MAKYEQKVTFRIGDTPVDLNTRGFKSSQLEAIRQLEIQRIRIQMNAVLDKLHKPNRVRFKK